MPSTLITDVALTLHAGRASTAAWPLPAPGSGLPSMQLRLPSCRFARCVFAPAAASDGPRAQHAHAVLGEGRSLEAASLTRRGGPGWRAAGDEVMRAWLLQAVLREGFPRPGAQEKMKRRAPCRSHRRAMLAQAQARSRGVAGGLCRTHCHPLTRATPAASSAT